jgi:predicted permease
MVGTGIAAEGAGEAMQSAWTNSVTPGYFATLRIPLTGGRDFTDSDVAGAPPVAIVNATAARRLWGDDPAIGRRFSLSVPAGPFIEVIGVARDARYDEANESPHPFVYLPLAQQALVTGTTLLVRSAGDAGPMIPALRERLRARDATLPVYNEATLDDVLYERVDRQRAIGGMLSAFGALALALAALGVYGVVAFQVGQRTREIGIRMAVGAGKDDVLKLIVGQGVRLAVRGVAVGLALALPSTLFLSRAVYGVGAADAPTFVAVALLLTAVAALAAWLPARRAALIEPTAALREG